ncbi:MAG: hypothetical protein IJH63_03195 [Methanobrevibacter sp.]|nr:hypothetical protein [Methanobrevibacter sp.]
MPNDRTPYLQDLVKYSRKATIIIHKSFVNGQRTDEKFELTNNALDCLKSDDRLVLTTKDVEDEYLEITISLKEDKEEDNV